MARLVYGAITSLDGFVVDRDGNFDWAAPDEEVHRYVNDQQRGIGTYLYGRRMYDVMAFWETMPPSDEDAMNDYAAIWRAADKVVFSSTLAEPRTSRTRIERTFDPVAVRALVDRAPTDVSVGGATLAGAALAAGLVDDLHQFVTPVVVGGGTGWLPDGLRLDLALVDQRRFRNGVVHLHYQPLLDRPSRTSTGRS